MKDGASLLSISRPVTGPGASALKYDILTALLVTASCGDPVEARLALRLSLLITARFNWRLGYFAVGQKEMARMWGVTERTAKREVAQMRTRHWISIRRPAARGRVAEYTLEFPDILRATIPYWDAVGPDFAARMGATPEPASVSENVVPLRPQPQTTPEEDGTCWPRAAKRLQASDPALFNAWLAPLAVVDTEAGIMTFCAPSRFMADYINTHLRSRLLSAVLLEDGGVREVRVIAVA